MIKPSRNPYGYRNLLAYKKAEELQSVLGDFVSRFPHAKTLFALSDQMERSARSTKQNITEGWKRNSTNEYYQFLGYAIASNAELEEDCTDICRGVYATKGIKGEKWGKWEGKEIESIPFYPLDPLLPLPVQLKLRTKELNFLLAQLQTSLVSKMKKEKTLSAADRMQASQQKETASRNELQIYLQKRGWD